MAKGRKTAKVGRKSSKPKSETKVRKSAASAAKATTTRQSRSRGG